MGIKRFLREGKSGERDKDVSYRVCFNGRRNLIKEQQRILSFHAVDMVCLNNRQCSKLHPYHRSFKIEKVKKVLSFVVSKSAVLSQPVLLLITATLSAPKNNNG